MTFFDRIQNFAILVEHITGEDWKGISKNERVDSILRSIEELDRKESPEGFKIPFWATNTARSANLLREKYYDWGIVHSLS
jgi:hypothetical protein